MNVKQKTIITGSNGIIGKILTNGLTDCEITPLTRPEADVRKFDAIATVASGHSAIIHLAWDTKTDNYRSEKINPDNSHMFFNVYQAALEHKIPRIIVASSVHADGFYKWDKSDLMSPSQLPIPTSPYGAHKIFMETLGKYFCSKGLEVICIRFGGIGYPPHATNLRERGVFLSERDGVALIQTILNTPIKKGRHTVMYAVSNNKDRIHDTTNPFGWTPKDAAEDFLKNNHFSPR